MRLVVGLGNPGARYAWTRHNVGFMVVASLRDASGAATAWEPRFDGLCSEAELDDADVAFLQPQTYMNRSGRSVRRALAHSAAGVDDLLVVHDDLDLPFGTVRVKLGGGAGGHRGIRSCIEELDSRDFVRVRVGIGRPEPGGNSTDYVLEPFDEEQRKVLPEVIGRAAEAVRSALREGAVAAMNRFNRRVIRDGGEP